MTPDAAQVFRLTAEASGDRIDRWLADRLPDFSRAAVQRLIDEEQVRVNDAVLTRAAQRVAAGDVVEVRVPPPRPVAVAAQDLPLDILYEDGDIIVVNKAAGMVVHPGAGNPDGTLVNALLAHCPDLAGIGGELRPGIVHRLDKQTSGALVVAKHDRAIRALQRQFKQRTVTKLYLALLIGHLPQDEGLIDAPIARDRRERKRMAVVAGGKVARTRWRVQRRLRDDRGRPYSLTDVHLLTGRTHQIRVHFAWLGYPLVGDAKYGPRHPPLEAPRQCLHARDLTVEHPITGERMTFTAPVPADFRAVVDGLTD